MVGQLSAVNVLRALAVPSLLITLAALLACGDGASDTPEPRAAATQDPAVTAAPTQAAAAAAAPTQAPTAVPAAAQGQATTAAAPAAAAQPTTPPTTPPQMVESACGQMGGTLRENEGHEWLNSDPPTYISHTDRRTYRAFYDSLIDINPQNEIIPRLAKSWELADGKDYVFELRDDVVFHDGSPFNADAVAKHIHRVFNIEGGTVTGEMPSFEGENEVMGPYTIKFVLTEASAPFLISQYDVPGTIESPTAVEEMGSLETHPVGTGPYKFVSQTPSIEFVGERNPNYWMPGLPCFDEYKLLFMPDASARLAAVRTGQIQIANELPLSSWDQIQGLNEVVGYQLENGARLRYIEFNHDSPLGQLENFRRAVALAVDREAFFAAHAFGTGKIGFQAVYPDMPWYNPELTYERDIEEAKRLVEATGLSPDEMEFEWYMSASQDESGLTVIQANLAQVGINFDIVRVDGATNSQLRRDSKLTATLGGWTRRPDPDPYFSSMIYSQSGWNQQAARLNDPEVDRLVELTRSTVDDNARREVFKELGQYMFDTGHHITLMYEAVIIGVSPSIKGYQVVPDGMTRFGQYPFWEE